MTQVQTKQTLYDLDLNAWFEDTLNHLRSGNIQAIDIENLIEEIEGLTKRDKRELSSRLRVLLSHLLKRIYINSSDNNRGWELTIREQRRELELLLQQSPSLINYLTENFSAAWNIALSEVKEDYPQAQFPDRWEYPQDIEVLLNQTFW
jgi:hypothetical protein